MAFLAPFIVGAAGLTGFAALAGQSLIGVGLSLGASYLVRRLQPKQSSAAPQGARLSLGTDTNEPREIPLGLCASAGSRKYFKSYGPNGNDYLQMVFKLGDLPSTSLEGFFANGKACTLGGYVSTADVSGFTVNEYPGTMWVEFHDGAWDQTADADLVAKGGAAWPSTYRGRGVCYVRVTLKFDADKYKDGLPRFLWVFKGAKLYDIRKDSTAGGSGLHRWGVPSTYEWSDNAAVCLYNFMRGFYVNGQHTGGMSLPSGSLPSDEWIAAANVCDENVSMKAGGTEKRYRLNGLISVATENATVIRDMLGAMAGTLIDSGGIFKPRPGVARASVRSFTDDDIWARDDVKFLPKVSRGSLINAVFGSTHDPAQLYEVTALPPRVSVADASTDGVPLSETYGLPYVHSGTQGQRILEIFRRRGRYQRRISLKLRPAFVTLEAGDWVTWTSARYNFVAMTFEVMQATRNRDFTISLELKEVSSAIYSWVPAIDELNPLQPATVGAGGSTFDAVTGIDLDAIVITGAGDEQRPGLEIVWTPITDRTVISLSLEYRKTGDTVALERTILKPSEGAYSWLDGVQGGITYEARLRPVTMPERSTIWSAWYTSASASAPQVVAVAASAEAVAPGAVTNQSLSDQTLLEIQIAGALASVQGSVNERLTRVYEQLQSLGLANVQHRQVTSETRARVLTTQRELQTANESFAQYKIEADARLDNIDGTVAGQATSINDLTSRVTTTEGVTSAQAGQLASFSTTLGANSTTISQHTISINGFAARWGVNIDSNGRWIGGINLDGSNGTSTIDILAGVLAMSAPGLNGGAPIVLFQSELVGGVPTLRMNGVIEAKKVAAETIETVHLKSGELVAARLRNESNTSFWFLDTQDWQIG